MSGKVIIFDRDVTRLGRLAQAVSAAGGEPIEVTTTAAALRAAASAELALLGGSDGLAALAALSVAHPRLPRITVAGAGLGAADLDRLVDAIRVTLVSRRPPAQDFEALTRDRLTGALCWHYFRVKLTEELERAARYTRPLSLMLVDLDDLRGINDRLGRAAGDFALAQVAQSLATGARSVDCIGRWSGGGFALLLPETAVGAAYGLAERLRADLAARRLPAPAHLVHPTRPLRVTASCGVASLYKEGAPRRDSLLARADHALWRAKLGGRNRSIVD